MVPHPTPEEDRVLGECSRCGNQSEVPVWLVRGDLTDNRGHCSECDRIVEWEEVVDDE